MQTLLCHYLWHLELVTSILLLQFHATVLFKQNEWLDLLYLLTMYLPMMTHITVNKTINAILPNVKNEVCSLFILCMCRIPCINIGIGISFKFNKWDGTLTWEEFSKVLLAIRPILKCVMFCNFKSDFRASTALKVPFLSKCPSNLKYSFDAPHVLFKVKISKGDLTINSVVSICPDWQLTVNFKFSFVTTYQMPEDKYLANGNRWFNTTVCLQNL